MGAPLGNTNARGRHRRRRKYDRTWWTHERVIEAGKLFFATFGELPTDVRDYQRRQQFTGVIRNGRASNQGRDSIFPSSYAIFRYFDTLRQYWTACGFVVDRSHEDWSDEELWFIKESVGILPRTEVARITRRSVPAIKRKLYDLGKLKLYNHGTNSYTRWGWTISHAAKMLGVKNHILMRYVDHGLLPIMKGCKCLYVDPADLMVVREYNWAKRRHKRELDKAVRHSLIQRACYALLRYDWRPHSMYQPQPKVVDSKHSLKATKHVSAPPRPEKPTHIRAGDEVRIAGDTQLARSLATNRAGRVKSIIWSNARCKRTPSPRMGCWSARVQFEKLKRHGSARKTVCYNVPVSALEVINQPKPQDDRSKCTKVLPFIGRSAARPPARRRQQTPPPPPRRRAA